MCYVTTLPYYSYLKPHFIALCGTASGLHLVHVRHISWTIISPKKWNKPTKMYLAWGSCNIGKDGISTGILSRIAGSISGISEHFTAWYQSWSAGQWSYSLKYCWFWLSLIYALILHHNLLNKQFILHVVIHKAAVNLRAWHAPCPYLSYFSYKFPM